MKEFKFTSDIDMDIVNALTTALSAEDLVAELTSIAIELNVDIEHVIQRSHSLKGNRVIKSKYDTFDDEIIVYICKLYPTNVDYAFKLCSLLTCRTIPGVRGRYYTHLKHSEKYKIITCGSTNGFSNNVKNAPRAHKEAIPEQNLRTHEWLLKEMLEIPIKERNKILSFFR